MSVDAIRADARDAVPGAQVQVASSLAVMRDNMAATSKDLNRGVLFSLPVV